MDTGTDASDRLVFLETWTDRAAHEFHMQQDQARRFIFFHEPFHERLVFQRVTTDA